jgi:hypothetical protein
MPEKAHSMNNGNHPADNSAGWSARSWNTFRKVLLTWCFVFLLVLFPLDLLFRFDSFVKFLAFMHITLFWITKVSSFQFSASTNTCQLLCPKVP